MESFANNVRCVLLWDPQHYRTPDRPISVALSCAALTTVAGLVLVGPTFLFLLFTAWLIGVIALPAKLLYGGLKQADGLDTPAVLLRTMFAGSVSTWLVAAAIALELEPELVLLFALHAVAQVASQAVPEAPVSVGRKATVAQLEKIFGAAAAPLQDVGPSIGSFRGWPIAAWLRDSRGVYHDFVGCMSDAANGLPRGYTLLGTGVLYAVRGSKQPAGTHERR